MNITELKALAEKATPGPWKNVDGIVLVHWDTHPYATWLANFSVGGESMEKKLANSAFCAAANPAAILELIAQLEDARTQMERQKDEWLSWEAKRRDLEKAAAQLEDAQGEIRALRATEAGLRERVKELEESYSKSVEALKTYQRAGIGNSTDFLFQNIAYEKGLVAISAARALLEKKE